jgi:chromosome segregation ATPase
VTPLHWLVVILVALFALVSALYKRQREKLSTVLVSCRELDRGLRHACIDRDGANARCEQYSDELRSKGQELYNARAAGEECAHRLAQCDLERVEVKANFAKLAALSRQLEERLRDCIAPPITSPELQALTRRMAVLQTERDVLTVKLEKAEATLAANEQRMAKVEQLALAQASIPSPA